MMGSCISSIRKVANFYRMALDVNPGAYGKARFFSVTRRQ